MARDRDYQLGIVINPDVGEEQARAIVERVNGLIDAHNGRVIRVLAWGRRRLAYPIAHHRDGLYFWFDTQFPPEAGAEIERQLHVQEAIIRHLITLRDPRIVTQERQRAEEADARAAAEAEARAAQAAAQPSAVVEAPATEAPATTGAADGQGRPAAEGAAATGGEETTTETTAAATPEAAGTEA